MQQPVSSCSSVPGGQHPLLPGLGGFPLPGGPLHPAFLPPQYLHPSLLAGLRHPLLPDHKGKSFTIDAILGAGRRREGEGGDSPGEDLPQDLRIRRNRPEGSHPYPLPCPTALRYPQIQGMTKERIQERKSSSGAGSWKQSKSKRVRTIFTPEQLERMEAEFERQQYMVGTERYYLAASLNLTEAQVKVWFQNRRIKWRKQNLEQQHAKLANLELFTGEGRNGSSEVESDTSEHREELAYGPETGETSGENVTGSACDESFCSEDSQGDLQICERSGCSVGDVTPTESPSCGDVIRDDVQEVPRDDSSRRDDDVMTGSQQEMPVAFLPTSVTQ